MPANRARACKPLPRNRSPCKLCQASKRKCDQASPRCSRCQKANAVCEPSDGAAWRVATPHSLSLSTTSSPPKQRPGASRASDALATSRQPAPALGPRFAAIDLTPPMPSIESPWLFPEHLFWGANDFFAPIENEPTSHISTNHETDPARPTSPARSAVLLETVERVLKSSNQSGTDLSSQRAYLLSSWDMFTQQIVPTVTPLGSDADNPFIKHTIPLAERTSSLCIAVCYLGHSLRRRQCSDDASGDFLEKAADHIFWQLDNNQSLTPDPAREAGEEPQPAVLTLAVLLIMCLALGIRQETDRLVLHMEYAAIVCQELFKVHADDESFLYLVKLLGYLQSSSLFSTRASSVNAPDYLSAVLEFHSGDSESTQEADDRVKHCLHFRDLDRFSGLSAPIASILYTLGTLIKKKKTDGHDAWHSPGEVARSFQSDVDGLEVRFKRLQKLIDKSTTSVSGAASPDLLHQESLTWSLVKYNEAMFWSAYMIFLTELKSPVLVDESEIQTLVEQILEACAAIPPQSAVAPLLIFPLTIGGTQASKKLHREFVMTRLNGLRGLALTNVDSLCADLNAWWLSEKTTNSPVPRTDLFVL